MGCCSGKTSCKKAIENNKAVSDSSGFEIKFGPDNAYNLWIPVATHHDRKELAAQLRAAADRLDAPVRYKSNSAQKMLPFLN